MDEREKVISELFEIYAPMLRNHAYSDLFKTTYSKDDLVGKVFEKFLDEIEKNEIIDPEGIRKHFKRRVYYLILPAIEDLNTEHRAEIKIIGDGSIKDFYDKVQDYVKQGFDEYEAKQQVRREESLVRNRLVSSVSLSNPYNVDDQDNESFERDIPDQNKNYSGESLAEKERVSLFEKAQAICFQKYRKDKGERDHDILYDFYLNKIRVTDLAEKFRLAKARISQIHKPGMRFINNCIRCELKQMGCEVA